MREIPIYDNDDMVRTSPVLSDRSAAVVCSGPAPTYRLPILGRICRATWSALILTALLALLLHGLAGQPVTVTSMTVLSGALLSAFVAMVRPGGQHLMLAFAHLRRGERYLASGCRDAAECDFNVALEHFGRRNMGNLPAIQGALSAFEGLVCCQRQSSRPERAVEVATEALAYARQLRVPGERTSQIILQAMLAATEGDSVALGRCRDLADATELMPHPAMIVHIGLAAGAIDCGDLVAAGVAVCRAESLAEKLLSRPVSSLGTGMAGPYADRVHASIALMTALQCVKARLYIDANQFHYARSLLNGRLMQLHRERWARTDDVRLLRAQRVVLWHIGLVALAERGCSELVALCFASAETALLHYLAQEPIPVGSDILVGIGLAHTREEMGEHVERLSMQVSRAKADDDHHNQMQLHIETSLSPEALYPSDDATLLSPIDQRLTADVGLLIWRGQWDAAVAALANTPAILPKRNVARRWNAYLQDLLALLSATDEQVQVLNRSVRLLEALKVDPPEGRLAWNVVSLLPHLPDLGNRWRVLGYLTPQCTAASDAVLRPQWERLQLLTRSLVTSDAPPVEVRECLSADRRAMPERLDVFTLCALKSIQLGDITDAKWLLHRYLDLSADVERACLGLAVPLYCRNEQKWRISSELLAALDAIHDDISAYNLIARAKANILVQLVACPDSILNRAS